MTVPINDSVLEEDRPLRWRWGGNNRKLGPLTLICTRKIPARKQLRGGRAMHEQALQKALGVGL